jgi:hypothetical protein
MGPTSTTLDPVCTPLEPLSHTYASYSLMPLLTSSCWTSWTVCTLAPPSWTPQTSALACHESLDSELHARVPQNFPQRYMHLLQPLWSVMAHHQPLDHVAALCPMLRLHHTDLGTGLLDWLLLLPGSCCANNAPYGPLCWPGHHQTSGHSLESDRLRA